MIPASASTAAIEEFSARVRTRFGPRLAQVILFGSRARGDAREDSDIDVLVVLDGCSLADAREIDAIVGDLLTRTDVLLSPLVLSAARYDELRARERRLVAEIDREGVPV